MKEITIYLDEATEEKLSALVQVAQISQSEWIATLIQEKLASERLDEWPEAIVNLAGAWVDSTDN